MKAKWIGEKMPEPERVVEILNLYNVDYWKVGYVNWQDQYPYKPEVEVRIALCEDGIVLHYRVTEDAIKAEFGNDNGNVWTDSCVEFFSIPAGDGIYYNLECNCIGTILLGAGRERKDRERASQEILDTIGRWTTLGREPFGICEKKTTWEVALTVPYKAFFKHNIQLSENAEFPANFYKCGDTLPVPHFLSWAPIKLPKPNFHCPEFFA